MTEQEKLDNLRAMCGMSSTEISDTTLTIYLGNAKNIILRKAFPLVADFVRIALPVKYESLQVEIANELVLKRGAEGEVSHKENGVNRSYESGGVSSFLLSQIVPCTRVISVTNESAT